MSEEKYETKYTTGLFICPYCGYRDNEIGEYGEGEYTIECAECGGIMTLDVEVTYYYSTFGETKEDSNPINPNREIYVPEEGRFEIEKR